MGTSVETGHGRMAADLQMVALHNETPGDSDLPLSDEVEELSKSLREAVQDENVQPKLQCLMMDPSFSMVTVQSEDSNISWETSFNPATAPWAQPAVRAPSARHAGNIIFIMDDVHTVRKKRTKRKAKEKKAAPPPVPPESSEELEESRPAMREVATPNVKDEPDAGSGEAADSSQQKQTRLFRLVSESTEILNIVVPPKVATVDEEESKTLADNLAYMEDSPIVHPSDMEATEQCPELGMFEPVLDPAAAQKTPKGEPQEDVPPASPFQPPPPTGPAQDYCNVFTLYDRPSTEAGDKKEDDKEATQEEVTQGATKQVVPEPSTTTKAEETAIDSDHPVLSGELCCDLLDDVFYGGTEESEHPEPGTEPQKARTESTRSLSRKESGSVLFEEEDDVLTPIYLPEGPQKIIDPILLEEPKAMAFLYTDLYEEAVGSRMKDEDAVSLTSEKSFHSQQSDREDKGYLEKFLLTVDGPPMAEKDEAACAPSDSTKDDGNVWPEEVVELAKFSPSEEEQHTTAHAEEVTDFMRDSNNSSPFEMVEKADVELEESIDNRLRQVTFKEVTAEDIIKSESEPAEESASAHEDPHTHLDATVLAGLEELHGKEKPVADDRPGITGGNKGMVSQQNAEAEAPTPSVEPQAADKPIRPFLDVSALQPAEPGDGGMAESMVIIEKGEEVMMSGDLQTTSCKEEEDLSAMAERDKDVPVPTDSTTDVVDIVADMPSDSTPDVPTANDVPLDSVSVTDAAQAIATNVAQDNVADVPSDSVPVAPLDIVTDVVEREKDVSADNTTDVTVTDIVADVPSDSALDVPTANDVPLANANDVPPDSVTDAAPANATNVAPDNVADVPSDSVPVAPLYSVTDSPPDSVTDVPPINDTDKPSDIAPGSPLDNAPEVSSEN